MFGALTTNVIEWTPNIERRPIHPLLLSVLCNARRAQKRFYNRKLTQEDTVNKWNAIQPRK